MSEQEIVKNESEILQALDKEKEKINQYKPEDIAAAFFKMEQPRFKKLVDSLSHRQLKRLTFQLVSGPLVPQQYVATTEEEKNAYYLGDQMIYNRMIMQLSAEMERAENAQKTLEQTNNEETKVEGEKQNESV